MIWILIVFDPYDDRVKTNFHEYRIL